MEANQISDLTEIENLASIPSLVELTVEGNPIGRKRGANFLYEVKCALPQLQYVDATAVDEIEPVCEAIESASEQDSSARAARRLSSSGRSSTSRPASGSAGASASASAGPAPGEAMLQLFDRKDANAAVAEENLASSVAVAEGRQEDPDEWELISHMWSVKEKHVKCA